jgi:hypothetical protein
LDACCLDPSLANDQLACSSIYAVVFGADSGTPTWENKEHGNFSKAILQHIDSPEEIDLIFCRVRKDLLLSSGGKQRSWTNLLVQKGLDPSWWVQMYDIFFVGKDIYFFLGTSK